MTARSGFWFSLALASLIAVSYTPNGDTSMAVWGFILTAAMIRGLYRFESERDAEERDAEELELHARAG